MGKIIAFPGSQSSPRPGRDLQGPGWASHVDSSPWFRFAMDLISLALAEGIPTSRDGDLVVDWPPDPGIIPEDVLVPLLDLGILRAKRSRYIATEAGALAAERPWTLYAMLFEYSRDILPWDSRFDPRLGGIYRDLVPTSLGFLKAACADGPLKADYLVELAALNLDLERRAQHGGISLDRDDLAARKGQAVNLLGAEWFHLTIEKFAWSLGLVILEGGRSMLGGWHQARYLAGLKIHPTELLQSL